jgi:hypothetical protein
MYADTTTWNFFKGCGHGCIYCWAAAQAKRQRPINDLGEPHLTKTGKPKGCWKCYKFVPHLQGEPAGDHNKKLTERHIPRTEIVFVAGNSDIAFIPQETMLEAIELIKERNTINTRSNREEQYFYLQSKAPHVLNKYLAHLPHNVRIVTTLETNRDKGYNEISLALIPSLRFRQFKELKWPQKIITIEPILDFDMEVFLGWISEINPVYVYLGYASPRTPKNILKKLPQPPLKNIKILHEKLTALGIPVRLKELRGLSV